MNQQHTFALEFLTLLPLDTFNTILDVGAGPGYQTEWLLHRGKDAVAVDVTPPIVDVPYMKADMTVEIPVDEHVDAVWSHHALEHVENPQAALREFHRIIKPGGWLFLTVPQIDTTISNGHIQGYNMPLLVYHLALAGFDTASGHFGKFRSHLRVAVQNTSRNTKRGWNVSLSELSERGLLPHSTRDMIVSTGRFNGASLTTTWLDGSTHTY